MGGVKQELTGADVRAERNRQMPLVTQAELAEARGWGAALGYVVGMIERGDIEVTQAELQRLCTMAGAKAAEKREAEA